MARSIVVGTAGHIDHGKSAIVRALTGIDPDRLKEEQQRGITIDLGFAHVVAGDVTIALVDVPGHERFVRNMLAGAGAIDAVLLVVAANEAVKPQTREHFDICRLLGITRGVIALSKVDLVDGDTEALAALEVRELVAGSFLEHAPLIAVSALTSRGLDDLRAALAALADDRPRLGRDGVVRLDVDRAFTRKGFGTVVTGTLVSGETTVGAELALLPAGQRVRVRGLHVHGAAVENAQAPRRLAINLGAVEVAEVPRGVTLATPDALPVTRRVDARVTVLPAARPLAHGARVRVHHGAAEHIARVSIAAVRGAGANSAWRAVAPGDAGVVIAPGGEGFVRLRFAAPVVVTRGDRIVLRAPSPPATIGGAVVLDPEPPVAGVRRRRTLERFQAIADDDGWLTRWVADAGEPGLSEQDLVRRGGLGSAAARTRIEQLVATAAAVRVGTRIVHPAVAASLARARAERVASSAGVSGVDAADAPIAAALLQQLAQAGLTPPDAGALAAAAAVPADAAARVLARLARDRGVVRVDTLHFHPDVLERLKTEVLALAKSAAPAKAFVDVATFKARYGLTRKFAIPLLEWLDRERVTRRVGDKREVVAR
ncbi:MAG TPA: selenocysteine-specific translation elongation factor [Vicinamibacterales bacterium]|nr:selenocysteine-specific translation elongation factor [Vicinamibacterales bacterium]